MFLLANWFEENEYIYTIIAALFVSILGVTAGPILAIVAAAVVLTISAVLTHFIDCNESHDDDDTILDELAAQKNYANEAQQPASSSSLATTTDAARQIPPPIKRDLTVEFERGSETEEFFASAELLQKDKIESEQKQTLSDLITNVRKIKTKYGLPSITSNNKALNDIIESDDDDVATISPDIISNCLANPIILYTNQGSSYLADALQHISNIQNNCAELYHRTNDEYTSIIKILRDKGIEEILHEAGIGDLKSIDNLHGLATTIDGIGILQYMKSANIILNVLLGLADSYVTRATITLPNA